MCEQGSPGDRSNRMPVPELIAGKYAIQTLIGSGSMGSVYRCLHVGLDKIVALKVLHPDMAHNTQFVERFKREARAASRLDHPNSVRVMDFGEDASGLLYIAMEHIEGRDLFRVLQEDWPFENERIVDILSQVLAPLTVAHALGVVHRDLKPENIMMLRRETDDDGKSGDLVKVCDFSIAHLSPARSPHGGPQAPALTLQGFVVGTPAYMSPEQTLGEPIDARSDIYAAGVLLFQLLTGRLPFVAESPLAVAAMQCSTPAPRPSELRPVHPALEAICQKALGKRPEERYQSAREMRDALQSALGGLHPASGVFRSSRESPRSIASLARYVPALSRTSALALLLVALGVIAAGWDLLRAHGNDQTVNQVKPAVSSGQREHLVPERTASASVEPPRRPARSAPAPAAPSMTNASVPSATPPPRRAALPSKRASTRAVNMSAPSAELVAEPLPARSISTALPSNSPAPLPMPAPVIAADRASVSIDDVVVHSGTSRANVRRALKHTPLTRCYRDSLRTVPASAALRSAELAIATDLGGHVVSAVIRDRQRLPPALRQCIETAIASARVRGVDTGPLRATVRLSFRPR